MATGMMVGGMALQGEAAYGQYGLEKQAGRIQAREAEIAAKQEELGAIQREGDRKERLAEAMATQNAQVGASGIAGFEGSPLTVLDEAFRQETTATERDQYMTRLSALTIRSRGKIGETIAKQRAKIGLMSNLGSLSTQSASYANI